MLNRATVIRPLARFYLRLRYQVFGRRYRRLALEQVQGVPVLVLPDVFNPVLFRTGVFLVETLQRSLAEGRGRLALDMGAGSGIGAIFTARRGYRVTAVDINPAAVRCTRLNALLNKLEASIDVRQGDLFEPVRGERFDVVLFNPPFFRGAPKDALDHAWRGTDVMERFAAGLPNALRSDGQAWIILSTDGDAAGMLSALEANRLTAAPVARRDLGNELLTVYTISPAR